MNEESMNPYMKIEDVEKYTTLSRASIYKRMATGDFPRSFKILGFYKRNVWKSQEIIDWMEMNLHRDEDVQWS